MPPLTDDDTQAASDTKPPARQQYYAVRRCDSLRAPAIFLHKDDCSFYVANEENKDQEPAEYQSFDHISEAIKYISSSESIDGRDNGRVDPSKFLEKTKKIDATSVKAAANSTTARTSSPRLFVLQKRSAEEASLSSAGANKKRATTVEHTSNALSNESRDNAFNLRSKDKGNGVVVVVVLSSGRILSKTELEVAIQDSSGWPDKREKQSPFLEILRLAEKNRCEKGWMRKLLFGAINEPLREHLTETERESLEQHIEVLKRITPRLVASVGELRTLIGYAWNLAVRTIAAFDRKDLEMWLPKVSIEVVALSSERSLSKTELEVAILVSSGWPDKQEKQSPFLEILRHAEKNACEKGWMRKLLFASSDSQPKARLTKPERDSLVRHIEILKRITPKLVASIGELRTLIGSAWNLAVRTIAAFDRKDLEMWLPKVSVEVVALSSGHSLSKTELEDAIQDSSGWSDEQGKQSPFLEILRQAEKYGCEKGWMRKLLFGSSDSQPKAHLTKPERESLGRQLEILKIITPGSVASLGELRNLIGCAWNLAANTIAIFDRGGRTKNQSTRSFFSASDTLASPSLQRPAIRSRTASKPD